MRCRARFLLAFLALGPAPGSWADPVLTAGVLASPEALIPSDAELVLRGAGLIHAPHPTCPGDP